MSIKNHKLFCFENEDFLKQQVLTYIGNKRKLLTFIEQPLMHIKDQLNKDKLDILDGFSGSGIVSRYFKQHSNKLIANDLEYYSYILNRCYLTNQSDIPKDISHYINFLNQNKLTVELNEGFIRKLYSPLNENNISENDRVFYTVENAKIIDNIRRLIDKHIDDKRYIYLAPLLIKASVHANTSGVFKGFYKKTETGRGHYGGNGEWCLDRIKKTIEIDKPIFSNFECEISVFNEDINDLVDRFQEIDVAYYDPPYNMHPYGSNYFMLNLIARYEEPTEISKVSGIPKNWNKSSYNYKQEAPFSLEKLIKKTPAKFIILSYSNEGHISINDLEKLLEKHGTVQKYTQKYNTFKASRNLKNRSKHVEEILFLLKKY